MGAAPTIAFAFEVPGNFAAGVGRQKVLRNTTNLHNPAPRSARLIPKCRQYHRPIDLPPRFCRNGLDTQEGVMSLPMSAPNNVSIVPSPAELNDEILVARAKSGVTDAFVELSKRHANKVFQVICRVTRDR